jgi:hypothetical protein
MPWLRFASALVLALWIGGLVALALAAPLVFSVLEARDPANGRALAGFVVGAFVDRAQWLVYWLGGTAIGLLVLRAFLGPRPRRLALRIWTVAAMLALTVAAGRFITPRVAAIRDAAGGRVTALADGDPRRAEFNRLHGLSNAVMLITIVAGAGLLLAEVRDGS